MNDIERAELLDRECDRVLVLLAHGVIAGDRGRIAADALRYGLGARGVEVGDHNLGAFGGETLRDGAAQTRAAAGDQCHFARKPAHALRSSALIGVVSSSKAAMRPRRKRY